MFIATDLIEDKNLLTSLYAAKDRMEAKVGIQLGITLVMLIWLLEEVWKIKQQHPYRY